MWPSRPAIERLDATATIVGQQEHDLLWDDHVKALPWFADYPAQTGRVIPLVRLTPTRTARSDRTARATCHEGVDRQHS